ncbi:hypothetical protein [Sulfoacidibacillus thermotolerans]|uniref:Uncharacterized protein n=1 Tax=Sulfoacidibacillus thermotolerans TaxID=1765684 RepID=A0A2U3D7Y2_SULT2|nr:hypothetical protein [Sulfoacidibacillus thermotolerans]PWI57383.1 hypothetical protein BM613_08625 [Sulfoacidibacillus thermotolerans]
MSELFHFFRLSINRIGQVTRGMNDWLADHMSLWLSSMWLFWGLTVLILFALALQRPIGAQGWILFIVSVFFQGVALPVLAFVSTKQGDRMESVLQQTHDATLAELEELKAMHKERDEEIAMLQQQLKDNAQTLSLISALQEQLTATISPIVAVVKPADE